MSDRLSDLRQSLQDIVDVADMSEGSAWYAHVARKALDEDDKAKKAVPKVWTGPDLQRLFNAWRAGDDIDSLGKRFGQHQTRFGSNCIKLRSAGPQRNYEKYA